MLNYELFNLIYDNPTLYSNYIAKHSKYLEWSVKGENSWTDYRIDNDNNILTGFYDHSTDVYRMDNAMIRECLLKIIDKEN